MPYLYGCGSETLVQMCFLLHIIGNCNGQICHADAGRHLARHQEFIATQAVLAGALFTEAAISTESDGWGNHRPIHIGVLGLQVAQPVACGVGAIENLFRELGRINQLHAGCHEQAARAAHGQKIGHFRRFGCR